ncbi:PREDICTED: uncharacterized protein LOC109583754 isoform X2 [Amphimedon queenslandica]|uniref:Ig-like domain-containing protein n=1 Tax=Amphimedon queenslandica TaxID=400682 RepID=A0AAN0JCP1_AMPQE|nr:PREDICTED: uncharacterized protein LOC109583754 isoform X2 [Amphimedon queenslandica]|eukprot:XP_019854759.1 PREDICTED: uncharacterized protein LOC109583754 isoform X2 [Amphimedon queenslandica]
MPQRQLTTACQLLMTLGILFSQCPAGRASCNENSQLARFKNAATLTMPGADISALSIVTGQSVQLQCQSKCGSLQWLLDGGNINNQQENTHQTVYMANCQGQSECRDRNFIFCDENQSLIDLGPLTSNLTITFRSPGVHVLQCEGMLQGLSYGTLGRFHYHSRVVLINVTKNNTEGDLASATTEPSHTEAVEPSATAARGARASSADTIISDPLPSFSNIQKTTAMCIPSITTVSHCPLNTNSIMSTTPAVSTTVTTTHSFLSSCSVTITTTQSSAVSSCSATIGGGINVVGDRLINKDPTSLAMTGTIGLLLILTVIGWVACLIATCKIKRTKGGRGVYRVHNFPIINQDDENGTIKSTTCETRRTLAQPNRYTTVHLRSSHESVRSMHKSMTPPALLQTPPRESVLRQGSVEAYTVNVNKEREPIQKRESLL